MTDSIWKIIRDHEDGSPITDLTATVVGVMLTQYREVAESLLTPVVRQQIRLLRRHDARKRETEAFGTGSQRRSGLESGQPQPDPLLAIRAIVSTSFWDPGTGARVRWGEATVEQHQRRADYLRNQASASLETASRHDLAIEQIEKHGVTCLNEALKAVTPVG